jgi:hypothetical protein
MRYYKGIVCFELTQPLISEEEAKGDTMVGFFRNVSVAATNEGGMKEVLASFAKSDEVANEIDWDRTELQECKYEDLSQVAQARARNQEELLFWYRTNLFSIREKGAGSVRFLDRAMMREEFI